MKLPKRFVSAFVVGSLFVSVPFYAFAKELNKEQVDYVSLGDSLAAGLTPDHQPGDSYADYLEKRFEQSNYNVDLTKYGVSGYTTVDVIKQLSSNENGIQESIKDAEVVTIDIGANDLLASLKIIQENPLMAKVVLASLSENLSCILSKIKNLNQDAKVYVMGYYNPFPHLPEEEQAALLPLLAALNQTIEDVSSTSGDIYVSTEKVIEKHEEEYVPNIYDIHLSPEGYQVVAKEFWKAIMKNK